MSKRTFTVGVLVVAALLAVGGLFASNMGFKVNFPMLAGSDAGSLNGTNLLALPFNRQTGLTTAKSLIDDIGSANVISVSRLIESTNAFEVYDGTLVTPDPDFPLATGEGYIVRLAANVNYIVVGSHDPSFPVDMDSAVELDSLNGTNFYSYPYHSTATTSKGLIDDIGSANVISISRHIRLTNAFEVYDGTLVTPDPDFALAPGEAYLVRMGTTTPYTPSHF